MCHNRICTDYRTFSYCYTWQNHTARTDPYKISNMDTCCSVRKCQVVIVMLRREKAYFRGNSTMLSNCNLNVLIVM